MAITYPISPDSLWTVYKVSTSEAIATRQKWAAADGGELKGQDADFVYLLEITEAKPTFDNATHKLVKDAVNYDTINNSATTSWSVVALSAEEIADRIPANVEISGIKYDTSEQSQNALTRMMTLVTQSGMLDTDEVAVKDCLGVSHTMTVAAFKADLINFGLFCYNAFHSS
tara:strand:- start:119 stop:634 length:516 start_codon:yes stop_codon:yes gene_type:complete